MDPGFGESRRDECLVHPQVHHCSMVGKRKTSDRKGESNDSLERNPKKGKGVNPFLPCSSPNLEESPSSQLGVSGLYSTFSEPKQSQKSQTTILDVLLRFTSASTLGDANHLTNFLKYGRDLESKQVIARMLIPWVIDKIIKSDKHSKINFDDSVFDKTILLCLDILNEDQTRTILSTQVIAKLVAAILGSEDVTDDLQALYVKLLAHYRPTMDVACKAVLCNVKPSSPLMQPTVQWLLSLHQNGKGNPKTTFQLVSDLQILLLLNESAVSKKFLSAVLFDPQQHLDGFLALLQAESDSTFKTYHLNLFQAIDEGKNDEEKREKMNCMLPLLLECFFEQTKVFFDERQRRKGLPLAAIQFRMFRKWSQHLLSNIEESLLVLSQMLLLVEESNAFLPNKECTSYLGEFILPLVEVARDESMRSVTSGCFCSLLKLNHAIFGDHIGSVVTTSVQCDQFMATLVDTFKRLRQQHFIYNIFIKNAEEERVVARLRCADFSNRLIVSFASATFFEVKETFRALEAWHKQRFDVAGTCERNALQIVATIVVPSVRVDHGNSKDIAISCQELVRQARDFQLTALCLNLHLKCLFWLGKHTKLQLPEGILSKLDTGDRLDTEKEAVATVWCHRLRENTFLIQEKEVHCLQALQSGNERELLELKQQCETIAHLVSKTRCWKVVLDNFHSWIQYSSQDDIELLCRWMWKTFGEHRNIDNTNTIILGLLKTSYFYEHEVIANNLQLFALTEVLETILEVVKEPERLEIASTWNNASPDVSKWPELRPKTAVRVTSNKAPGDLQDCANKCTSILSLVLQLPVTTKTNSKHLEMLLRIDLVCRSIARSVDSATPFFATIAKCRTLLSNEFNSCSKNPSFQVKVSGLGILHAVLQSMIDLIQSKPDQPYSIFDEVIKASGKLFYSVTSLATTPITSSCITKSTELFLSLKPTVSNASLSYQQAVLGLLRSFTSAMITSFDRDNRNPSNRTEPKQLYTSLKSLVVEYEQLQPKEDHVAECGRIHSLLNDWATASQWTTEGPAFCSAVLNKMQCAVTFETILEVYPMVSRHDTSEILGAVMKAIPEITDQKYERLHAPLDALFCRLIKISDSVVVQDCVKILLQEHIDRSTSLRYLHRCLTQANEEDQIEVLHRLGREVLSAGLKGIGMVYIQRSDFRTLKAALRLIKELLLRRGVFTFRESDLAGLLSRLSDILNGTNGSNEGDATIVQGYAQLVYLTAIQRYTKVIYACAPLVIYTLRQFLISILDAPSHVQDDKGRSFIQICSLLSSSKDVYKKYVVGVVLEFARRLDGRSYGFVLPAIYALLDMMSSHENEQLNALMDDKTRSLFKPIYDAYQKHHVFKG